MSKALKTWFFLAATLVSTVALVGWANHPELVQKAQKDIVFSVFLAFIVGWLLRVFLLRKKGEWVLGLGLSICAFSVQTAYLVPTIPSHDFAQRILWPWAAVVCAVELLYLSWEEWTGFLANLSLVRKLPPYSWSCSFAVLLFFAAYKTQHQRDLLPKGAWSLFEDQKNLCFALMFLFWGLVPVLRQVLLHERAKSFRSLGLFLLTVMLWHVGHDTLHIAYRDQRTDQSIDHEWTSLLIWAHFLLSAYFALYWEGLQKRVRLLWIMTAPLAVIPLIVSSYFNPGNWTWAIQAVGLTAGCFWEPWLRERWWKAAAYLGAIVLLLRLTTGYSGVLIQHADLYLLIATAAACGWRYYFEKTGVAFLRTLYILLYAVFLFNSYVGSNGYYPWEMFRPQWLFFLHLIAALLTAVYWEKFKEGGKEIRWNFAIFALVTSAVGLTYSSFIWLAQWVGFGLAWLVESYAAPYLERFNAFLIGGASEVPPARREPEWRKRQTAVSAPSARRKWLKMPINLNLGPFFSTKTFRWSVLGSLLAVMLGYGGLVLYHSMTTYVVSMTPTGTVASLSTVIRMKFSDSVVAKGDLQQAIHVTPELPGSVRLEDDTTLVFTPSKPLKPATYYEASLDSKVLTSKKGFLQSGTRLRFNTEPLKVVSSRLFYTYDLMKGFEKEMDGELEFNYPVDVNALKKNFSARRGDQMLSIFLEPGTLPNRFFFRAQGFERGDEEQTLKIEVGKDLVCADCGGSLGKPYEAALELLAKPKFVVKEVQVHHQPGSSLVSILFSKPVSREQVKAHLTVSPGLPISFQTEYCYVVLKGEFEPNTRYEVGLDAGLRSLEGDTLGHPVTQTVTLQDAAPRVKFADRGRLIPSGSDPIVAVKTVNLDNYQYDIHKVFRNNLLAFLKGCHRTSRSYRYYRSSEDDEDGEDGGNFEYETDQWSDYGIGASVTSGSVTVGGGQINEEVETSIHFGHWQAQPWKGLFTVQVRDTQGSSNDSRWFLVTDIGLLAKRAGDDLWVQALSISKVKPVAGVKLSMVSDTNQVIQEQTTDKNGRVWFKNWKNNPYNFRPIVLVAEKQGDWSFLRLDDGELNTTRFDVGGEAFSTKGWDGFLTTDRGLYRPGDTVHFTGIVRQADLSTPDSLPVRLTVYDGQGNEMSRLPAKLSAGGMAVFELPLRSDVTTGNYSAVLQFETGQELARTDFKTEEFIPNKIKAEVQPKAKVAAAGEQLVFDVRAHHLFGAAATDLKVRARVRLREAVFKPKQWDGYKFSDESRGFEGDMLQVPDGVTDDHGVYSARLPIPLTVLPPSMLEAVVYAEVFDTGGRPVGASSVVKVHRYPVYLGLKSDKGRQVTPGKDLTLRYVAVDPEGKPVKAGTTQLIVKRKIWYSVFRRSGWSGRGFESSFYEETVLGKEIPVDGKGSFKFNPDKPGEYTVYLGNSESMRTSLTFVATGLGSSPEESKPSPTNLEAPEKLYLALTKKTYGIGDKPTLEVRAPFAGTLVLTLEREKIYFTRTYTVPAGLSELPLPAVSRDLFPNVYVVGVLVHPPLESLRDLPGVSFGIIPLAMDVKSRKVDLQWKAPDKVRSRQGISVDLSVGASGTKVVLAAVDEGILQIVDFKTPDPFQHFYRKRGLSTTTLSLFDDVLPQLDRKAAVGGGDMRADFASRHLNPIAAKRVKSYAKFSGILTADARGRVAYHFPTDQFHGEVRVMALAVEGKRFGSSAHSVNVADAVIVEPSFPRFMAPLDVIDVPVLLYNQLKEKQDLKLGLKVEGPVALDGEGTQTLSLAGEGQKHALFHAKAKKNAGVAKFTVVATDSKGENYDVTTELAVRPANPLTTETHYGEIQPNAQDVLKVPAGFIPEGQKLQLVVSSSPLLTFLRSLDYLITYPYGCTEQVTSGAFPLLYFGDMGLLTGRFSGRSGEVERFVQAAVDELQLRQREDGTFAPWPSSTRTNDYLSNYASHFLLEAKAKGYDVKKVTIDRIRQRIGGMRIVQKGGRLDRRKKNRKINDSSYVLYLKALAGIPDKETMNRMRDEGKRDFYLSLAYSQIQDRGSALRVIPNVTVPQGLQRNLWDDWFSPNKHAALYLLCLSRSDPENAKIKDLVIEFGKRMKDGHFGNTQEDAWCFMALGEAVKTLGKFAPLSAGWKVQGGIEKALKGETAVVSQRELSGHDVVLTNHGSEPLYYHLLAEGTRLESKKEDIANGITVSRAYRDEKGNPVNLGSITQGELIVVTLKIKCSRPMDNLVVVDLLPGGFEVDNPRLASRGRLGFDPPCSFTPAYQDFRDDRVLLFSEQVEGDLEFSYSVRAVTPGKFQVPGLLAEAMYDPDLYGRSNENETLVVAPLQ